MFQLPSYEARFQPLEEHDFPYIQHSTVDGVVNRFKTWSAIASLPEDEKEKVAHQVKGFIENGKDVVWVDKAKGILELPMKCPTYFLRRK